MSDQFSPELQQVCADAGIDIESSYARMQADIRDGSSPLVTRLANRLSSRKPRYQLALSFGEARALAAFARLGHGHRVALELGISKATVQDQIAVAVAKLGARNVTHAVALAIRRGIIQPPARPAW